MKLRSDKDILDFRTALWVSFWLFVGTKGTPDLIDALIAWIGRQ